MQPGIYRFGTFELDVGAYRLRSAGVDLKLEHRPMALLLFLLERRGNLVTREDIVDRLWGRDVFVDVEAGIHTAVRKIRKVLGDPAANPVYLETVPGKGYRFKAGVTFVPPPAAPPCVAVLPVAPLDQTEDSRFLAAGITEEVIAALGRTAPAALRVIGRTTMMRYQQGSLALPAVVEETGAEFLVESSLRTDGNAIRLVARLLGAKDQVQLWCGTFDGERRQSIFALQRELSVAIATQVHAQLSPASANTIARRQPSDPAAYDLYLRGRYLWHQLSPETTRRAMEHFRRAAALDPDYALPWAGIAVSLAASPITSDVPVPQVIDPARQAADQAARCGFDLAETHTAMGFVQFWLDWDFPAAETSFRRAIELDASDSLAHRTLGIVLSYQHHPDQAQAAARTACELDPLNSANFALASQVAYFARRWPEALAHAKRAVEIDPAMWVGYQQMAQAYERMGHYEQALQALAEAQPFCGQNSKTHALRGFILAAIGQQDEAREVLRRLSERSSERFVPPFAEALIWLGLGDRDEVFRALDRAVSVRDVHLNFLLADAKWDTLAGTAQFRELLARCGFRTRA